MKKGENMKDLVEKLEAAEGSKRTPKPGILLSMRIPPLIVRGLIAHMEAHDLKSVTAAAVDLISEGLVASAIKGDDES